MTGLDPGDRRALDQKFLDSQCLMDTEDRRFVLKGPQFPPMEVSIHHAQHTVRTLTRVTGNSCIFQTVRAASLENNKLLLFQVINCLVQERGYSVQYNPQQHGIPPKQGATDDKYVLSCLMMPRTGSIPVDQK